VDADPDPALAVSTEHLGRTPQVSLDPDRGAAGGFGVAEDEHEAVTGFLDDLPAVTRPPYCRAE